MKNNLEAGSGKIKHTDNALYARFTPDKVLVGMISLLLLLLSLIGAITTLTGPHAFAASALISTHSGMKHTLVLNDTSTSTTTPTLTPTSTLTATATITPSPSSTVNPSPTATSMPSPTAATTVTTPPSPSISPTRAPSAAIPNATRGATGTPTTATQQSLVPGQTATTTSNSTTPKSMPQEQQKNTFPFIALTIGVPGITATLLFLLIGWWLLRKRLLPNITMKLPPSGANPWSRVRPNDLWGTNVNGAFQHDGNNTLSSGPVTSETNIPQVSGKNGNNANAADAYEQWLRNNSAETPDFNDPYLKEIIKEFSNKTRAAHQQNLSNFRND